MSEKNIYIGDGVYANFDGFGIWLRTGNHQENLCDNQIYLEPDIVESLYAFFKRETGCKYD